MKSTIYSSPLRATQAHKKSDVWSLGCILYSMVYGEVPFRKFSDPLKKMAAIQSHDYHIPFPSTTLGTDIVNTIKVVCLVFGWMLCWWFIRFLVGCFVGGLFGFWLDALLVVYSVFGWFSCYFSFCSLTGCLVKG